MRREIQALRQYMIDNEINQAEMADRLGISATAVSKWLLGRNGITPCHRDKIASVCGLPPYSPAPGMPQQKQLDTLESLNRTLAELNATLEKLITELKK